MIAEKITMIHDSINEVKIRNGITHEVVLCAVSKTYPPEAVLEACLSGQNIFGENRVQEAYAKFNSELLIPYNPVVHIIGHLQRNKAREAVQIASMIQSIDKLETLLEVEKHCIRFNKTIDYLIEVNTSGEAQKSGIMPEDIHRFLELIRSSNLKYCKLRGVMTVGPLTGDESVIRKSFSLLRKKFDIVHSEINDPRFSIVSMGMSGDYKIAIEEGSTMVRIGSLLFGQRVY